VLRAPMHSKELSYLLQQLLQCAIKMMTVRGMNFLVGQTICSSKTSSEIQVNSWRYSWSVLETFLSRLLTHWRSLKA